MEFSERRRKIQKSQVKVRKNQFAVGDIVLYRNILRKNKEPKWIGPFIVIKVSKVGSCKIKNVKNDKIILAQWNNLKPVYSKRIYF